MARPRPETAHRRALPAGLAAAAAGGLLAASLPPPGWWPLAPLGVAWLARLLAGAPARRRAGIGAAAGAAQFGVGLAFVANFTVAGAIALVATEALLVAGACVLVPAGRGRGVGLVGAFTLLEAVRDRWPFGGMPLGGLALGQSGGPLLGLARLGGPLALAAATTTLGVALAHLSRPARPAALRRGVLLLGLVGGAAAAAARAPAGGAPVGTVRVAAIQGGGARGSPGMARPGVAVLAATLAATDRLGRLPGGIVLWPEDAVPLGVPLARSGGERLLADIARRSGATLVAGVTAPAGARFDNELVVVGPTGRLLGRYEKTHPVPFGEVVPFRGVLRHFVSLAAVPRDMVVGRRVGAVATPAGRIGLLISYETFFPAIARADVRAGAELLLVATNTASYATDQVPAEELAASRLVAVATGRAVAQAATTGISAAIAPSGAVLEASTLGRQAIVRAVMTERRGRTLYVRFGDAPLLALAGCALLTGWSLAGSSRRRVRRRASAGVGGGPDRALGEAVCC